MDTNLIINSSTGQTTVADRYCSIYNAGAAIFSTSAGTGGQSVMPCAGTLKNFYVNCDSGPISPYTRTYKVYKNGADTAMTVSLADTATTGNDTSNTVSVSAGDTISVHMTATGGAGPTTSSGTTRMTLGFAAAANTSMVAANTSANFGTAANTYLSIQGQGQDATALNTETVMPTGGTFKNAYGVLNNTPGAGKTYTVTLYVNGAPSALTFQWTNASVNASDTSHSVSVSAGDKVYWEIVPGGTPTARQACISAEFDPTTNGESIHTYSTSVATTNSAARYQTNASAGTLGYSSTESPRQAISQACTWKNLYVYQQTALTGIQQYSYQFIDNGSAGSPSVAITSASQSGNDTSNTATSTAGETVAMKITPTSTPATTITEWGIVSYIAPASTARTRTLTTMGAG